MSYVQENDYMDQGIWVFQFVKIVTSNCKGLEVWGKQISIHDNTTTNISKLEVQCLNVLDWIFWDSFLYH